LIKGINPILTLPLIILNPSQTLPLNNKGRALDFYIIENYRLFKSQDIMNNHGLATRLFL
jgi:hypothetical protein